VILLDGGRDLEPSAETRRLAAGASLDPVQWQAPQFDARPGQVRRYGSDFAMEPPEATFAEPGGVALRASRAAGGLSNLWGSAVLPYAAKDMAGWPVPVEDMDRHAALVAEMIPMAARGDGLARLFPSVPVAGRDGLPPSVQASLLFERLDRRRAELARLGVTFGQARQAVRGNDCRLCGQCLHGCPWGLIWSARHSLAELKAHPQVDYRPGAALRRFSESADGITLHLDDGSTVTGDRAFLGAGVLETARILLASQPGRAGIVLRDSQQAFLPALHLWRAGQRPDLGTFHTLPQAFLEIDDRAVSPHLVHAQVYTWNEHFPRDLVAGYGRRLPGSAPAFRALARRLIVAQVFLHSDHSHRIRLTLAADGRLSAEVEHNNDTVPALDRALRRMAGALRLGGLLPLRPAARSGAPGSSFHVGASVPMAANPVAGQSDALGRPYGLTRLHLIDASSLPAIPATTITLGVMANAHRIASAAP
jgi:choline dehydrogenase-like flavoprotein